MQRIYSSTSTTTTTTTTQWHSSRPYSEVDVGGGGKVSSLERGVRGKVAQQNKKPHTYAYRQLARLPTGHTTRSRSSVFLPCVCVCAALQHGQGGSSVLLEASALSTQTIRPGTMPHTGQQYALVKGGGTTCALPRTISTLSFLHPILHPACHTHFAGGQPISSHRAPNSTAPASTRQYQAHISPATPTHPKIDRQPSRLVCFRKDMMQRQQPVWLNARRCMMQHGNSRTCL